MAPPLLLQLPSSAEITLNAADTASRAASSAWNYTWQQALSGGLYTTLCNLGITIAVACLTLWTLAFARKWLADEVNGLWAFEELIWPLIVILFLSNAGANLRLLTQEMRQVLNRYNDQILQITASEIRLDRAMAELADYNTVQAKIMTAHNQCNTIVAAAERKQCLELRAENAEVMLRVYQQQHPSSRIAHQLRNLSRTLQDPVNAVGKQAASLVLNSAMILAQVVLVACQGAFQYAIECSWLLTALMAPIALGASLLPFGAKPIYAWLVGFWSVGFCKLCLNLITGLVAVTAYQGQAAHNILDSTNTLVIALFMGIFAPLLAIALASGGGMAVFNGILSMAGQLAGMAASSGTSTVIAAFGSSAAGRATAQVTRPIAND